jgi:hypothetical protein
VGQDSQIIARVAIDGVEQEVKNTVELLDGDNLATRKKVSG